MAREGKDPNAGFVLPDGVRCPKTTILKAYKYQHVVGGVAIGIGLARFMGRERQSAEGTVHGHMGYRQARVGNPNPN